MDRSECIYRTTHRQLRKMCVCVGVCVHISLFHMIKFQSDMLGYWHRPDTRSTKVSSTLTEFSITLQRKKARMTHYQSIHDLLVDFYSNAILTFLFLFALDFSILYQYPIIHPSSCPINESVIATNTSMLQLSH